MLTLMLWIPAAGQKSLMGASVGDSSQLHSSIQLQISSTNYSCTLNLPHLGLV